MVPNWECTGTAAFCGEIVPFAPKNGYGYEDYPLNGETAANQYRSFMRRDVMMLIQYAAAMVECQAAHWTFGNHAPLGLGDMSEADGAIPGTSIGSPGHPAGTHVNGHDMDIGYYTLTGDNRLRTICEHTEVNAAGATVDAYHCTGPAIFDAWRTALFIGHMHVTRNFRVVGVDGQAGLAITAAVTRLCGTDFLDTRACTAPSISYEVEDGGAGWYRFHHHHFHVSVSAP